MEEIAGLLGCMAGTIPIPYLGLKIGGRLNGYEGWSNVIEKIKERLSKWDVSTLSMGGRATIVNSILNTMPLYCMSFLPLPKRVAQQLQSLQCSFLWGGNMDQRKMAWISWKDVCKSKNDGGLGVKDLSLFNQALLIKWIWRFLVNKNSLWARVIIARHGDLSPHVVGQNRSRNGGCITGWWSKILAISGRDNDGFFWKNLSLKLGNGTSVLFWHDKWAGDKALRDCFPRLYQLSANKEGKTSDMGSWIDNCWRWELLWRRTLLDREVESVKELLKHIQNYTPRDDTEDEWRWGDSPSGVFTVKTAYAMLARNHSVGTAQRQFWSG